MIDVEGESANFEQTSVQMEEVEAPAGFEVARGVSIGRYLALRRIGAGGMGVVWAAWDPELDREVAIKLLGRRFRAGAKARGRLLREAQAMARLDHPNIVGVHDVGIVHEQVFVAMDFVRGQTLREWVEQEPRAWETIVAAYHQAALGLAAAHEVGLVHRDFKPDNAMIDGRGRVRVMDFGLAAYASGGNEGEDSEGEHESWAERDPLVASHVGLGSASDFIRSAVVSEDESIDLEHISDLLATPMTEVGAVLGTPAYMSPEQIKGARGEPASDQFALCVALWQALFGDRPYAGESVGELWLAFEARKLRKPPAKPRLPKRITVALTRGLAFHPHERWPSMAALAEQLDAPPAGRSAAWALSGALLLVAGAVGVSELIDARELAVCDDPAPHFASRWDPSAKAELEGALRQAGPHGEHAWVRVEAGVDTFIDEWMGVWSPACRGREGLPESLQVARALCLERHKDALEVRLDLLGEADAELAARAFDMISELPPPADCADAERLAAAGQAYASASAEQRELQRGLARVRALHEGGRVSEALAELDALTPKLDALGDAASKVEELGARGRILLSLDRHAEALESLREAYSRAVATEQDEAVVGLSTQLILAHEGLAQTEAARAWQLHAEAFEERTQAGPVARAERLTALAVVADNAGEYEEALRLFGAAEEILSAEFGEGSLRVARMLDEYGGTYSRLGRLEEAAAVQQRSLEIVEAELGAAHPEVGGAHLALGNTCYRAGELARARVHFERAQAIVEPSLGPAHFVVTGALTGLGAIALGEHDNEAAAASFRAAVERIEAGFGPEHPNLVPPLVNLGISLKRGKDYAAAEAVELRALELLEQLHGPKHPNLISILDNLGELAILNGDFSAARERYARSLLLGESSFGPEHPELDYALIGLGDAERKLGHDEAAWTRYARVLAHMEVEGKDSGLAAEASFGLARLEHARGRPGPALERASEALALHLATQHPDTARLAEIEAWITGLRAKAP